MFEKLKKIVARLPEPAKTRIEEVRLGETAHRQQCRAAVRRVPIKSSFEY